MNMPLLPLGVLLVLSSCGMRAGELGAAPSYIDEAPLPKGWPAPGPYNRVTAKSYPAYRAAFTTRRGEFGAFWTLFGHIKKHDIPMSAPVEMTMTSADDSLARSSMAFLYQDRTVGTQGPDGNKVEVRDVAAAKALSYTWQGPDSKANLATAKVSLDGVLAARKLTAKEYRLLGYNSPGVAAAKRTWELQALLKD